MSSSVKTPPVDVFKKNALLCLAEKREKKRTYPITRTDLILVTRCPLCGGMDTTRLSEVYLNKKLNFFSTDACNQCLFTFRSISLKFSWFERCWKKIYTGKLEVFNPDLEKFRKKRYESFARQIARYVSTGRILDIGASHGTGANLLRARGYTVETIEAEITKRNYIKKFFKLPVVASSIEEFLAKKPTQSYDAVIFAQCLEHLDHPQTIVRAMKRILHPGSIVYLEIPILWNYVSWHDALYLPHKSNFTEQNIVHLVTASGFVIERQFYVHEHSKDVPWDLGMLLRYVGGDAVTVEPNSKKGKTMRDVRRLYRRDLPFARRIGMSKILRYDVPYIEHFFQILNLEKRQIVPPSSKNRFITFPAVGSELSRRR